MDPPSASGSGPRPNSINQMAFCHECGIEIRPLMTPDPTCPRCNGQFVEVIEENASSRPQDFDAEDDDEGNNPFAPVFGDPFPGFTFRTQPIQTGTAAPQGLGGLLMALATGGAHGPRNPDPRFAPLDPGSTRGSTAGQSSAQPSGTNQNNGQGSTRSGATSFGPFGLQWNVQYGSGGGDPYQRAAQNQADQNQRHQQPPTLSNFLRFAFGPQATNERTNPDDPYFHDDGMGGAGSAADGRHFNHDNRGTYHQPPQAPHNPNAQAAGSDDGMPPELAALRNLFTGLFGEPGGSTGSLLDMLAAGAQGGGGARGQWGDYVLGQQGLDDIISQLMEQTQGSNAPPPASEDVIDKLERFTLADKARIQKAKNQDCPTCKDDFLPSPPDASAAEKQPETGKKGDDDQQEDLISMPCGHIFHVDCLVPWLRLHGTCPVCRVSIAKPREGHDENREGDTNTDNTSGSGAAGQNAAQQQDSSSSSTSIPGGWPSPPNPFTTMFNQFTGRTSAPTDPAAAAAAVAETVRHSSGPPGLSTTAYQTSPPASTTLTSTIYPAVPQTSATAPRSGAGAGTGLSDVEVVNTIVSSPPIVSDREEFFAAQSDQQEGGREGMRETLRRAAEARVSNNSGTGEQGMQIGQGQQQQHGHQTSSSRPALEPDELD